MAKLVQVNATVELPQYGFPKSHIRLFYDGSSPALINYLDLTEPETKQKGQTLYPDGAVESQGHPILYFVNESRLASNPQEEADRQLGGLRKLLACRGERSWLARIRPGELLVTPVKLSDDNPLWKTYRADDSQALTFFSRLAQGGLESEEAPDDADYVFSQMYDLLNCGIDRIVHTLGWADVLSLVGRALFFRFLCDRAIVTNHDLKKIAPQATDLLACFNNAENAFATCQWLDRTFNGDFLPLRDGGSRAFFDQIGTKSRIVYTHLSAIVTGLEPVGAEDYQMRLKLKWSDFDFAHIPVGLLSQVYEAFCWKWQRQSSRVTSVHYTPRRIAAILVDEAFDGLPNAENARVLDPACGAGVFLVLALRMLYRETWLATKKRPDTKKIRQLLETQLTGFDINDSALRLSALSLYLTAIELDPQPLPPEKLRFKKLNNLVLFNHRLADEDPDAPVIGSLGQHVGTQFDGKFDLVLSNPPWTSLAKDYAAIASQFTAVSRAAIARRGDQHLPQVYHNPDSAPDMAFLWKSTEWCRPGGRIAMALPARILFKQEEVPRVARETMFRLIEITGIINGSNLSDTPVWPKMAQPFMLLFARNRTPAQNQVVQFITPQYDAPLNRKGEYHIDSKSADPVEANAASVEPWLWKCLTIGTSFDVEVVRRIKAAPGRPLKEYWENDLGLICRNGYQIKEKQTQRDASFLYGLPNLDVTDLFKFVVNTEKLLPFSRKTACWPRTPDIYQAPLVLVQESPGQFREDGRALLSFKSVAYCASFHGYSAAGHTDGKMLVRYLHLFVHSSLWVYYALMTSPKFGVERRTFYKGDLDNCPIIPYEKLTVAQKGVFLKLCVELERDAPPQSVFSEIDAFFGHLYGLTPIDIEVMRDTLAVCLPYGESRSRACGQPSEEDVSRFVKRMESFLKPFFRVLRKEACLTVFNPPRDNSNVQVPFRVLFLGFGKQMPVVPDVLFKDTILKLADDTGATRIIQQVDGGLVIGLLNQYRYWTPSRARLLGAEIVRSHMGAFEE